MVAQNPAGSLRPLSSRSQAPAFAARLSKAAPRERAQHAKAAAALQNTRFCDGFRRILLSPKLKRFVVFKCISRFAWQAIQVIESSARSLNVLDFDRVAGTRETSMRHRRQPR